MVSEQGCISLPGRLTHAEGHPARDAHREGGVVPRAAGVCRTRRLARAATTRVRSSVERHRRPFLLGRRLLSTGSVWILWAAELLLLLSARRGSSFPYGSVSGVHSRLYGLDNLWLPQKMTLPCTQGRVLILTDAGTGASRSMARGIPPRCGEPTSPTASHTSKYGVGRLPLQASGVSN